MNHDRSPSPTTRHQRRVAALVAAALALAACGSSASDDDTAVEGATTSNDTTASTAEAPDDTAAEATESVDDPEPEPEQETVPAAEWAGPDPVATLDARMDELRAFVGQPMTAEAVAPLFEIPSDFPYPAGPVAGVVHAWDRDLRITDEIRIDEMRIIGLDPAADEADFDAVATAVEEAAGRWSRASSQRDSLINDLYTSDDGDGDGVTDRLVVHGRMDPAPFEPTTQVEIERQPTEIPEPAWAVALPHLENGELVEVVEGVGRASDFGDPLSYDGRIEIRWFHPAEELEEVTAFLTSGVVEAANFTIVDSPGSNFIVRIDVEAGEWSGIAGVSEVSVNNEVIGHHLWWSLSRGVPG